MDTTRPLKCVHSFTLSGSLLCREQRDNPDKSRMEEIDCTGKLLRYRRYGSSLWHPAHSPAEALMNDLADVMDAAKETRVVNAEGGVKADGGKPLPRLLYISLRKTLASMVKVLSIGARKYSPDNWNKVEQERYWDAFYRHIDAHHSGEMIDPETGEPHLTHALCCLAFISEQRANGKLL